MRILRLTLAGTLTLSPRSWPTLAGVAKIASSSRAARDPRAYVRTRDRNRAAALDELHPSSEQRAAAHSRMQQCSVRTWTRVRGKPGRTAGVAKIAPSLANCARFLGFP